jgi:hypothetical protein
MLRITINTITILSLLLGQSLFSKVVDSPYFQEFQKTIEIENKTSFPVIKLDRSGDLIYALSPDKLYSLAINDWTVAAENGPYFSLNISGKNILLGGIGKVFLSNKNYTPIDLPKEAFADTVLSLLQIGKNIIFAGTNNGLYRYQQTWQKIGAFGNRRLNDLVQGPGQEIWAATNKGLFHFVNGNWSNLNDYVMAPGLKENYFSLRIYNSPKEILFGGTFSVGCLAENGDHWLITGGDGLPYGPVNTIEYNGEELWIGTPKGAAKLANKSWHFYNGKRWLAGNHVNDILCLDSVTTWIATNNGISEIKQQKMTLEEKTVHFEDRIRLRHDRYGMVSNSHLKKSADFSTNVTHTNDNDGLWTAIYLAAESFRYSVTGEKDAYENAVKAFEAMERLETITPTSGFPARSFANIDENTGGGGEWHPTKDGKWKWKGDTSSDEIVGHMFAFPIFYELVAKGDVKIRCKNLVDRIMTHIVDNEFLLVDLDGLPTRWGVWNPDSLNGRKKWWYERGINSLQILSFLKSAQFVTGNEKYQKAYDNLITNYGYAKNMVQQKMYGPYEINHSDDELAFLPYYCLLRYAENPELKQIYEKSLQRSWNVERPDRNPLWNFIASASLGKDCENATALKELQLIPMDQIDWRVENSFRWDVRINPLNDRFDNLQSVVPVPIKERAVTKWNSNPYRLDQGGNGHSEDDGAYFLLPYWMGRYHKLILKTEN